MLKVVVRVNQAAAERTIRRSVRTCIRRLLAAVPRVFARLQREPKTGRPGPFTRRSAPGEVPASQTGTLGAAIETTQPDDLTGEARWRTTYAALLETGTTRMAARPFLNRTVEGLLTDQAAGFLTRAS